MRISSIDVPRSWVPRRSLLKDGSNMQVLQLLEKRELHPENEISSRRLNQIFWFVISVIGLRISRTQVIFQLGHHDSDMALPIHPQTHGFATVSFPEFATFAFSRFIRRLADGNPKNKRSCGPAASCRVVNLKIMSRPSATIFKTNV